MKQIHFEEINSTSKYLKEHVQELEDMTFVSASFQTSGRGREDRVWSSNKGDNLLFSVLIKQKNLVDKYSSISLLSAVAVLETLKSFGIQNISIKWPNDVYVNDKKICGILLEGQLPDYLIVGIGLNVNQKDFAGEYRANPTSVFIETGVNTNVNEIRNNLYKNLQKSLKSLQKGDLSYIQIAKDNDYLKGKNVSRMFEGKMSEMTVVGIQDDNSIKAILSDGRTVSLTTGEFE